MADLSDKEGWAEKQQSDQVQGSRGSDQLSKGSIEMPAEKAYYLQKTQVLGDLQKEIVQWAKKRFWIVTAIIIVLGFFGSSLLIRETVRGLVEKEIADATRAAIIARESATRASLATEEVIKQAQTYTKTVSALQEKANKVDAQFIGIRQRLEAESANVKAGAAREAKDIATRLARLETLVAGVAKQPQTSQQAVADYQKEIAGLREAAFTEGKKFGENSAYYVTVYYKENASALSTKVVEKLAQAGFKATSSSIGTLSFPLRFSSGGLGSIAIDKSGEFVPRRVEFTSNKIIYGFGSDAKAKEIGDLLRPLAHFSEIRLWGLEDPSGIFSSSFVPGLVGLEGKRIAVFLVEKA